MSNKEYAEALRAYQKARENMKSKERDRFIELKLEPWHVKEEWVQDCSFPLAVLLVKESAQLGTSLTDTYGTWVDTSRAVLTHVPVLYFVFVLMS